MTQHEVNETTKSLVAYFTKRDVVLYALGIGCCCDNGNVDDAEESNRHDERELKYAYERHTEFEVFPLYLLALFFIAVKRRDDKTTNNTNNTTTPPSFGIRQFPPESMINRFDDGTSCGLLPKRCYRDPEDAKQIQDLTILHISQSLTLYDNISFVKMNDYNKNDGMLEVDDPPMQINLETRITCVKPRTIGTFVTSITTYHQSGKCIGTSTMVALILGLNPDKIIPFDEAPMSLTKKDDERIIDRSRINDQGTSPINVGGKTRTVIRYQLPKNAALLYRLSGDYNPLHVTGNVQDETNKQPVLHGLCTLGYSLRAVLRYVHGLPNRNERYEMKLSSLQCSFVKPVFVNDVLRIEMWDEEEKCLGEDGRHMLDVCFRVFRERKNTGRHGEKQGDMALDKHQYDLVLDKGRAQFQMKSGSNVAKVISRL
jgi:acyl dehydratase